MQGRNRALAARGLQQIEKEGVSDKFESSTLQEDFHLPCEIMCVVFDKFHDSQQPPTH